MQLTGFSPIEDKNSKILILGSMPSVKSLNQQEYYAHPQNAFWKILFALFENSYTADYQKKTNLLLTHHIALWDVLKHCVRPGSMDSDIKQPIPNDFTSFFSCHDIQKIYCNGQASYGYFQKYVKTSIPVICLPSTSPANARKSFAQKLGEWSQIKESL